MTSSIRDALISVLEEFDPGGDYTDPRIYLWVQRIVTAVDDYDAQADAPCPSEIWSWSRFRETQIDPYWIRCGLLGLHQKHEDGNTGLTWTDEEAA